MDLVKEIISRYSIGIVSLSIVSTWLLNFYELIKGIEEIFFTLISSMAFYYIIIAIIKFIYKIYLDKDEKKKNKLKLDEIISSSIDNFQYLDDIEQQILWNMFFENKSKLGLYDENVNNLHSNKYIKLVQKDEYKGQGVFTLDEKLKLFLEDKHNQNIINKIKNLTDGERKILNLFYEESDSIIDSDMFYSFSYLENSNIIEYEMGNYILIYDERVKKNMKYFRKEKITNNKVDLKAYSYPANYGGGAKGSS